MTRYTFFPVGNADTTLLRLADDRLVLMDYADMRNCDDQWDARCDLATELKKEMSLAEQTDFAVVCFSHLDNDHICGSSEFFWLRHAAKYQEAGRPKIDELWVPAAAITEEGISSDARVLRQEARFRLLEGKGIKVFSRPENLRCFLEANGLTLESRAHCIVDAGKTVPGFSKTGPEKAEFFVHCPFAWRSDERGLEDRNQDSVVLQITLVEGGRESYGLFGSDVNHQTLAEIVKTSKRHGNEHRLTWDILKLFHHCSYLSLGPDRGVDETKSVEEVKYLFEECSRDGCLIVSPSWDIPLKGTKEDDDVQPPHRQAANHHKRVTTTRNGEFIVTMETPNKSKPKPFRVDVTSYGVALSYITASAVSAATSTPTRAG